MKPRRVIITRGTESSVKALMSVCSQVSPESALYAPTLREVMDVTTETHIYQVEKEWKLCHQMSFFAMNSNFTQCNVCR